jgi:hypothetical protein
MEGADMSKSLDVRTRVSAAAGGDPFWSERLDRDPLPDDGTGQGDATPKAVVA